MAQTNILDNWPILRRGKKNKFGADLIWRFLAFRAKILLISYKFLNFLEQKDSVLKVS